jgi:hypothetical protein
MAMPLLVVRDAVRRRSRRTSVTVEHRAAVRLTPARRTRRSESKDMTAS